MIDRIVNTQEPIMSTVELHQLYRCILRVVFLKIQTQLMGYISGVNLCRHSCASFVQHRQDAIVHIVINKDRVITIQYKYGVIPDNTFTYKNLNPARNPYGRKGKNQYTKD